jgi:hypothetical protein
LRLDRGQHRALVAVEPGRDIVVADLAYRLARDIDVIDMGAGSDFTGQHDQPGLDQRFERDSRVGILLDQRVEDRIRNLVAHLVGMAFGDRLRGEQEVL